jgi:hypothetical protein
VAWISTTLASASEALMMLAVVGYVAATALHALDLALNVPDRRTLPERLSARNLVVALIADGQVVASVQDQVRGSAAIRHGLDAEPASCRLPEYMPVTPVRSPVG